MSRAVMPFVSVTIACASETPGVRTPPTVVYAPNFRTSLRLSGLAMSVSFCSGVREAGRLRGWPEKGTGRRRSSNQRSSLAPGSRILAHRGSLLLGVHPGLPLPRAEADGDLALAADQRRPEEPGLAEGALEAPLGGITRDVQAEGADSRTLAVDQRRGAEGPGEPPKLAARGRALLEVHERHPDP